MLVELARELTDRIEWHELPTPHEETFTRNDYNVWVLHAPGLEDFRSSYMRARITRLADSAETTVHLVPLAGDAQGWKPQFRDANARDQVWPPSDNTGQHRLAVTAVGRAR